MTTLRNSQLSFFLVLYLLFSAGCEDAFIDPFSNEDKYFTIYGFLDQANNFIPGARHSFRVIPVTRNRAQIETTTSLQADLDGRMFLTNVDDSLTTEMLYELKEIEPGLYGHFFSSSLFILPGKTYRVEIVREDEKSTYAETLVPNLSSVRVEQAAPVVNQDTTDIRQNIVLTGINALWEIEIIYHVSGPSCFQSTPVSIPYGRTGRVTETGWEIELDITRDRQHVLDRIGASNTTICAMGIKVQVMDDQWLLPEGELNLEEVSLPDNLTNVQNGYGFFGSIGLYQADWPINPALDEVVNGG